MTRWTKVRFVFLSLRKMVDCYEYRHVGSNRYLALRWQQHGITFLAVLDVKRVALWCTWSLFFVRDSSKPYHPQNFFQLLDFCSTEGAAQCSCARKVVCLKFEIMISSSSLDDMDVYCICKAPAVMYIFLFYGLRRAAGEKNCGGLVSFQHRFFWFHAHLHSGGWCSICQ